MTWPSQVGRGPDRVLIGLLAGLCLVAPGFVVSALLGHAGAEGVARYGAQFLTTVLMLLVLAWFQQRACAKRRPLPE